MTVYLYINTKTSQIFKIFQYSEYVEIIFIILIYLNYKINYGQLIICKYALVSYFYNLFIHLNLSK